MPWDKAGYKAQLGKDLLDIQRKLSRILGRKLAKNDRFILWRRPSPVKCIEGGVFWSTSACRGLVRGGVVVTSQIRMRKIAQISWTDLWEHPRGFPTPLTSSLMPPKPPRTKVREYAWRRNEICMLIRLLKAIRKTKKEKEKSSEGWRSYNSPSHLREGYDVIISLREGYDVIIPFPAKSQKAKTSSILVIPIIGS